jgi:uncharacterized protein (DUF302 family)
MTLTIHHAHAQLSNQGYAASQSSFSGCDVVTDYFPKVCRSGSIHVNHAMSCAYWRCAPRKRDPDCWISVNLTIDDVCTIGPAGDSTQECCDHLLPRTPDIAPERRSAMAIRLSLAASLLLASFLTIPVMAHIGSVTIPQRVGWVVKSTPHKYPDLVQKLEVAINANKMGLVNAASASDGAKAQGFNIPGNRVVGVFRNDFARRMLAASIAAGIEAPIRIYLTENADGTATLSYKTPVAVFAPYFDGAGADLRKVAEELEPIFAKIAEDAVKP